MDQIDLGLENFDAQARWRDRLSDLPIDVTGELPGKRRFNGPVELKRLMTGYSADLSRVLAQRVLTYALGRAVEYFDEPALDDILEKTAAANGRFDTIVIETALSFPFRHRRSVP
jgi:hypothetical protein